MIRTQTFPGKDHLRDSLGFQVARRGWQGGLVVVASVFLWWLAKSLINRTFFEEPSYFLPAAALMLFLLGALFILGFRASPEALSRVHLLLGAFLFCGILGEAVVRTWDRFDPIFLPRELKDSLVFKQPWRSWNPYQPGSRGRTHGNPVRINAIGMRGPEVLLPKPPGRFRILVLGDSFTFGQGVAEEETYPARLQQLLLRKYPDRYIEIVNLGVSGSSAVDQLKLLTAIGESLEPDLLLLGFNGNDVREGNQVAEAERSRGALPIPSRLKGFLLAHSRLCEWLSRQYDATLRNLSIRPDVISSIAAAYDPRSAEWRRFETAYRDILEWSRSRDLPDPIVGLLLPAGRHGGIDWVETDRSTRQMLLQFRQVDSTVREMGFRTVDYLPAFQVHNRVEMTVSRWEGHPNAMTHQLYAEGFRDAIVRLGILGSKLPLLHHSDRLQATKRK